MCAPSQSHLINKIIVRLEIVWDEKEEIENRISWNKNVKRNHFISLEFIVYYFIQFYYI